MCGRTACTLNPDQISRATRYRNSKGKDVEPKWRKGDKDKYYPSYNKAPMSFCPVMLHTKHLDKENLEPMDNKEESGNCQEHERAIVSMKWGLVPNWVKDPSQAQYKMNNARSDTMLTKASYKRPLEKGQRCVVLADGFYEWNTTKTEKQPYYIYFKDDVKEQKPDIKKEVETDNCDENGNKDEQKPVIKEEVGTDKTDENGNKNEQEPDVKKEMNTDNADESDNKNEQKPDVKKEMITDNADESDNKNGLLSKRILTMAGIFERRKSEEVGGDDSYSFSVITVDSHPVFTWLHHRMPAMLRNEDEVRRWLDFGETPLKEAVELIEPKDCLSWHPVSKFVNNSRNNSPECLVEIDLTKPKVEKPSNESKGMAKWLSKSPTKSKTEISQPPLKIKNENEEAKPKIKQETPTKGQRSPKKGQKRPSSGSVNLMEGWLKKAKKE